MLRGAKATLDRATGALRSRATRQTRRRLALKDAEISALRRELARLGKDLPGSSAGRSPVFFVVGNQKSGTTWLMRMLDAHPEVLCKGEGRFFGGGWRQKSLKQRDVLRPASSLYNAVLDAEYLRLWIERSVWSRNDSTEEHLNNLTRMAIDYFLEGELLKSGKRVVGDKSPLLTPETIREISAIYPEARVIHIVRDGTAPSYWARTTPRSATKTFFRGPGWRSDDCLGFSGSTPRRGPRGGAWTRPASRGSPRVERGEKKTRRRSSGRASPVTGRTSLPRGTGRRSTKKRANCWPGSATRAARIRRGGVTCRYAGNGYHGTGYSC
jgi:hypothetical protein